MLSSILATTFKSNRICNGFYSCFQFVPINIRVFIARAVALQRLPVTHFTENDPMPVMIKYRIFGVSMNENPSSSSSQHCPTPKFGDRCKAQI